MNRLKEKTKEIKDYISELESIIPSRFDLYLKDIKTKTS